MILPGNSRQIVIDTMQSFTDAPVIATSKAMNDLEDAGFRIVHHGELEGILKGLLELVESPAPPTDKQMAPAVLQARALIEVLRA